VRFAELVAQLVEQRTFNPWVVGSSPTELNERRSGRQSLRSGRQSLRDEEESEDRVIICGLNVIDLAIIFLFLILILAIGIWSGRSVKKQSDFYLGGRKLGGVLQFFLQFGNATDTTGAPTIATSVYRLGVGGAWLGGFQTLFITPFFWFTQPWWRRARLTTMADLFVDRFNSKSLATSYAMFNIFIALFTMGVGNVAAYKVASAMVLKPPSAYTDQDRSMLASYKQYQELSAQVAAGKLSPESEPYKTLYGQKQRELLQSSISYIKPIPFYLGYSLVVCIYISLGGLKAAVITNAVQGLLVIVMSVLIIPIGLAEIHGFSGLHHAVPEYKFLLTSDATWYSVAIIVLGSMLQVIGIMHNMSTGGSAKNEDAARMGMISGGFTKRLVIVAWIFCGLLAVGLLSGPNTLSDPDYAWGALSIRLLPAGLMGLMLSGMLLGHMPTVGVNAVVVSGLITRNLYEPLVKNRSEQHYLRVGKISVIVVMSIAILFALMFSDLFEMWVFMIRYGIYFGAAIWLVIFWRRVTPAGIMAGFVIWVLGIVVLPQTLGYVEAARTAPALLAQTEPYTEQVPGVATAADVAAGQADHVGQAVWRPRVHVPVAIYFDNVVKIDPRDPHSAMEGIGRFNVELYTLHWLGLPVTKLHAASKISWEWIFDSLLPFVVIMGVSIVTNPGDPDRADRFYAKMRTAVGDTPEEDKRQIELSCAEPHRFDDQKMFRNSQWQFCKWTRKDYFGFFGCWGIAAVILGFLWVVLNAGA
jgi:SSS family solute:Na+ symporter